MITKITGVPGAGKTLNAIKYVNEVLSKQTKDEIGNVVHRDIYYYNIQKLKLPWTEITQEQAFNWSDLPDGSIVILDECHEDLFPQRDAKKPVPDHIKALATHRHRGFDFVLISQHPMQMDAAVRRLVGRHFHFDRKFGSRVVNRHTWNFCIDNPNDLKEQKRAVTDRIKFDKKYYDLYHSTELDTHKFKIPPKLAIAIGFCLFGSAYIAHSMYQRTVIDDSDSPFTTSNTQFQPVYDQPQQPIQPIESDVFIDETLTERLPRIQNMPWTAPIYDSLREPQTYPKPAACLEFSSGKHSGSCKCYTQQGTKLHVDQAMCRDIVANGWFDDTIPDGSPIARSLDSWQSESS